MPTLASLYSHSTHTLVFKNKTRNQTNHENQLGIPGSLHVGVGPGRVGVPGPCC